MIFFSISWCPEARTTQYAFIELVLAGKRILAAKLIHDSQMANARNPQEHVASKLAEIAAVARLAVTEFSARQELEEAIAKAEKYCEGINLL